MDVLLNWLAQGALVALAAAALLALIPSTRPCDRYTVAWCASALVVTLPLVPVLLPNEPSVAEQVNGFLEVGPAIALPDTWWTAATLVFGLWALWAGMSVVRLAAACVAVRRHRRRCVPCPPELENRLAHWSRVKETGRRAPLVLSADVRSAAVLGVGSPLVALAPTLFDSLDAEDVDRLAIHEWAHVQRRDDVARLVEGVVRLVAGWHPALWWLDRHLHIERESACDEIVVALTGSAKSYAACLVTIAALPAERGSIASVAAVSRRGIRARIVRILALSQAGFTPRWRAIAAVASVAVGLFALTVGHIRIVESAVASLGLPSVPRVLTARIVAPFTSPGAPVAEIGGRVIPAIATRDTRAPEESKADPSPEVENVERGVPPLPDEFRPLTSTGWQTSIHSPLSAPGIQPQTTVKPRTTWGAAADAGLAIGRGSQNAGVATAGFFKRFGKKLAASF